MQYTQYKYKEFQLPVETLPHIDPSLEAHGDSSNTLSSSRCLMPWMYGAVVLEGRLNVFSAECL